MCCIQCVICQTVRIGMWRMAWVCHIRPGCRCAFVFATGWQKVARNQCLNSSQYQTLCILLEKFYSDAKDSTPPVPFRFDHKHTCVYVRACVRRSETRNESSVHKVRVHRNQLEMFGNIINLQSYMGIHVNLFSLSIRALNTSLPNVDGCIFTDRRQSMHPYYSSPHI